MCFRLVREKSENHVMNWSELSIKKLIASHLINFSSSISFPFGFGVQTSFQNFQNSVLQLGNLFFVRSAVGSAERVNNGGNKVSISPFSQWTKFGQLLSYSPPTIQCKYRSLSQHFIESFVKLDFRWCGRKNGGTKGKKDEKFN